MGSAFAKSDSGPDHPAPPDYLNLPCPVKYEEIQRENIMSLKPELFEGLRFDFTKPLNQRFSLSHSLFMGSVEVPSQGAQIIKVPAAHYEFGANLIDQRMMMLIGRILTDGRMSARIKYDFTDRFSVKVNAQLTNEPHFSQGMFHFDYRGKDYQTQLQLGNNAFYGFNYIQVHCSEFGCSFGVFFACNLCKFHLGLLLWRGTISLEI